MTRDELLIGWMQHPQVGKKRLTNDERADEHGDAGEEEGDDGGPPEEDSHVMSAEIG